MTRPLLASGSPHRASSQCVWAGILNVDKPAGLTSHDVVALVRRAAGQRKVGHAGTLDPMATGVLLVCLDKATRVTEYLMASPKTYYAIICLGASTTTDDAEGEIVARSQVQVSYAEIESALQQFVGRIEQTPPVYSALKREGQRLYRLARQGQAPALLPRPVEIYAARIAEWTPPLLHLEVRCGPGTYIRALARDLGRALGCGAHVASLRRTASGRFTVDQALPLPQIEAAFAAGTAGQLLYPIDAAVADLPALYLDTAASLQLVAGRAIAAEVEPPPTGSLARAYTPTRQFIAIVAWDSAMSSWLPRKVFAEVGDLGPRDGESPG